MVDYERRKKLAEDKQIVWSICTSKGYIDNDRFKTIPALLPIRRCIWLTEKGARKAFEAAPEKYPKLGPEYWLEVGYLREGVLGVTFTPEKKLDFLDISIEE